MPQIEGIEIEHLNHACFRLKAGGLVIYFDPFKISEHEEPADVILLTHEHFDHCSIDDIKKIMTPDTVLMINQKCQGEISKLAENEYKYAVYLIPDERTDYASLAVDTIPAYNINKFREPGKPFHPRQDGRVGIIATIGGRRIYHAGDTDNIPEMAGLKNIDIALLPVSGTYVMTPEEAAEAAKIIKPKVAIPMHYGSIVGTKADAEKFKRLSETAGIRVQILK